MQPETLTRPQLTLADRCDRCGAAAKVRAVLPKGGELLFCGHHANRYADGIARAAARIQVLPDFRWAGMAAASTVDTPAPRAPRAYRNSR